MIFLKSIFLLQFIIENIKDNMTINYYYLSTSLCVTDWYIVYCGAIIDSTD